MGKGERYYQHSFDQLGVPGMFVEPEPSGEIAVPSSAGRFIRELYQPLYIPAPAEIAHYLMKSVYTPFSDFEQEELWTLMLDSRHHLTHDAMIYRGSVTTAQVRCAEVFVPAVRLNRPAMVVTHNHPSGDPTPSRDDIHLTKQLVAAARVLDITLMDHVIIGQDAYVSLREKHLGFD